MVQYSGATSGALAYLCSTRRCVWRRTRVPPFYAEDYYADDAEDGETAEEGETADDAAYDSTDKGFRASSAALSGCSRGELTCRFRTCR